MNPVIEELKVLVTRSNDSWARQCESILTRKNSGVSSTEIPLKNAQDIYLRRAARNADIGEPVKGFVQLAENLKHETAETVGIHSIQADEAETIFFTTGDFSRLIGCLVIK